MRTWAVLLIGFCGFSVASAESPPVDWQGSWTRQVHLTFAGDLMAHVGNYSYGPFSELYRGVENILQSDDLSFVNLETPVDNTGAYSTFPCFNVNSEYVWAAIVAGFDVFSLANNHAGDRGSGGVAQTDAALRELQMRAFHINRAIWFNGLRPRPDSPPFSLTYIEKKGIKIGYIAVAEFVNIQSLTPFVQTTDCRIVPQPNGLLDWIRQIRPSVDVLILSYHWGDEYVRSQSAIRSEFSRKLVGAGVDILWGNHPHVLQPWYTLPSSRGTALVLPSMGNFVSGQTQDIGPANPMDEKAPRGDSALFKVQLALDFTGKIILQKLEPVLISTWKNENNKMVARTMDDLVTSLSGPWQVYYQKRREIMQKFYLHP